MALTTSGSAVAYPGLELQAWAMFQGRYTAGAATIVRAFNVSAIARPAEYAGEYTFTFPRAITGGLWVLDAGGDGNLARVQTSGAAPTSGGIVFFNVNGQPYDPAAVYVAFYR